MEALRAVEARGLEVAVTEQQVGRWPVETEAALAGIQRDEGQRGLCRIGTHDVIRAHAVLGQAVRQEVTEHVSAQHADELGLRPSRAAATATLAGAPPAY